MWVASAPTTETGNGESVAELAVLLMLAASRRLNEELAVISGHAQGPAKLEVNRAQEDEEVFRRGAQDAAGFVGQKLGVRSATRRVQPTARPINAKTRYLPLSAIVLAKSRGGEYEGRDFLGFYFVAGKQAPEIPTARKVHAPFVQWFMHDYGVIW